MWCHERHRNRGTGGKPQGKRVGRTNRGTTAKRNLREAVLQGARGERVLVLHLAQTASRKRTGAICPGREEGAPAGAHGGCVAGTGVGERRSIADWRWRGYGHVAGCTGCVAEMIHLPASVRVYLCR